jgi:Tfp pilus assembly protein PilO
MQLSKVEKFLSGKRKRWAGVVWGLGLTLLLALPYVDRSIRQYREFGELRTRNASKAELPVRARILNERVDSIKANVQKLETALVPSAALPAFKQSVTRMARDSQCRLRSIGPGSVSRRPLDEVLGKTPPGARRGGRKPAWEVEERVSSISIQGTFANLTRFFAALEDDDRILEPESIQIHPSTESKDALILNVSIKTLDLIRGRPG